VLCSMNCFQNSTYLNSPTLINFSLSTNLIASWPQIGRYGTRLGTLVSNFGDPSTLTFHNWIGGPSMGLQMISISETLYYIIGQLHESTKNLKICILVCPTKVFKPSFKQLRTHVLKSGISSINCGMKGFSCETMKPFIKSTKI